MLDEAGGRSRMLDWIAGLNLVARGGEQHNLAEVFG
jgi:hypothetical protein